MDNVTIISALHGWFIFEPLHDVDNKIFDLSKEPIIAWMIETNVTAEKGYVSSATPITADAGSCQYTRAIQRPDGSIFIPMDREFSSEFDLIQYLRDNNV